MLFSLKDKNVVVAGGGGQIGFSLVEILVDAGANVIIADLDDAQALNKVKKSDFLDKVVVKKLDVSNLDSIIHFTSTLSYNEIHGLVNCFHFKGNSRELDFNSKFFSDFENYPLESWDLVHDVNLRGCFLLTQKLIPKMKNCDSAIVNISSTYGLSSPKHYIYKDTEVSSPVAYASSKSAIINLSRYMATSLTKYKIRVNTLTPGGVFNNQNEKFVDEYCNNTPLGRMANARDYQGAILFLLSNASSYMTGSNLIIDGGWTAW